MTEKDVLRLIGTINEKLEGGKKLFIYNIYGKYNLKLKCNNKYNPYKELTPNASVEEIYWFLKGMLQTLDIINKKWKLDNKVCGHPKKPQKKN